MRNNPERLAWTVLLFAFTIFCVLVVAVPLGVRWYILNATNSKTTAVTSIRGTVLVEKPNATMPVPIVDGNTQDVDEATRVVTDGTSQAVLTFFNDSTVTLYGQTTVRIERACVPRFALSQSPDAITIYLERGRVRVAPTANSQLTFEVRSPQGVVSLGEGSFSIEASDEGTEVTSRTGWAQLVAAEEVVRLAAGERSLVRPGKAPSAPLPAEQNLLANGDFSAPLADAWQVYRVEPPGGVITTSAKIVQADGRDGLRFLSEGKDNLHSEIGIIQQVNESVQDFDSLRIQVDVRLDRQSLPGGGTLGSEFPVMVHLAYKDAEGNDRDWYHGFYYVPAPENWVINNTPDNSNERVARIFWYPYESVNLLDSLGTAKPVYIKYVRIYASGWLYDAVVTDVALLAQD
jgi:hypothetical protein